MLSFFLPHRIFGLDTPWTAASQLFTLCWDIAAQIAYAAAAAAAGAAAAAASLAPTATNLVNL